MSLENISLQDQSKMLWQFISTENRSDWFNTHSENNTKDFDELEPFEKYKIQDFILYNKERFEKLTQQEDWIEYFSN